MDNAKGFRPLNSTHQFERDFLKTEGESHRPDKRPYVLFAYMG
jgi:hypothetical protein